MTFGLQHYLARRGVLDIPNARSSHSTPLPRGGGLSIVVVFLLTTLWLAREHALSNDVAYALVGGGAMIAAVGMLDDHFHLSSWLRLAVHFIAAGWALGWLGVFEPFYGGANMAWPDLLRPLLLVGLVWLINLYNFMDGIDGLAGTETICVCGLGGLLLTQCGLSGYAEGTWALAAACGGFLVFNWAPARIFLGDVGSGFLGYVLGVFALFSTKSQPSLFWSWLILLSAFAVDSTVTLLRRLLARARWYEAHCSHAYQHAARRVGSHAKVTLTVAVVNVTWLFPLAWAAYLHSELAPLLAAIAVVPLIVAAIYFGAGVSRPRSVSTGTGASMCS